YSATTSGDYSVIVSANGCVSPESDATTVTVNGLPSTSEITGDATPSCSESDVTYSVTLTAGSSYSWSVPSGATITSGAAGPENNQITVDFGETNGNISVTETNATGCIGEAKTLGISLQGCSLAADFEADQVSACTGETVVFSDLSTGASGSTNYSWDFGANASPATATGAGPHNVVYSVGGQKTVSLSITDGATVSETKTNYITVNELPTPVFTAEVTSVIAGTEGHVYTTTSGKSNYDWTIPAEATVTAGGTVTDNSVTLTWNKGGSYSVSVNYDENGCSGALAATSNVTVTPTISIGNASATEGSGNLNFEVTLNAASTETVTVEYATANNTATLADNDYNKINTTTLTFNPGETTKTVVVTVNNDDIVEGSESLYVNLSSASNATIADDQGEGVITDNDVALVSISANDASGNETGPDNGEFTVSITKVSQTTTEVSYSVSGSADGDSDYTTLSGTVIIPANTASVTIPVSVLGDDIVEGDETVVVTLTSISSGDSDISIDTDNDDATVTIGDDDVALVSISANDASGNETGPDNGEFTVSITKVSQTTTEVSYSVSGSADEDSDYTALSGTVTIPANTASVTIPVSVLGDDVVEGDETVVVTLTSISSGDSDISIDTDNDDATVTIGDDDGVTTITVEDITLNENGSNSFILTSDKAVQGGFTVTYSFINVTATAGDDFNDTTVPVVFTGTAGETQIITINGTDDDQVEGSESFTLKLSSASALVNTEDTATGTIIDDDATNVTIEDVTVTEGGTATFTVTLNKAIVGGTTITYSFTDITATGSSDYNNTSNTIVFAGTANESHTFEVSIPDDDIVENPETFTVNLSSSNTDVNSDDTATGTITDNDGPALVTIENITVTEGETATYTITLDKAVEGGVTVNYSISDDSAIIPDDLSNLSGSVEFTGTAGETKTFEVPTTEDQIDEDNETYGVALSTSNSLVDASDIATGTITDNDDAGITISAISNNTTEGGQTATFTVVLTSKPTDNVTISLVPDDLTEGSLAVTEIVFTPSDWDHPQTIIVTGVDDADIDGNIQFNIVTGDASSLDAKYSNKVVDDVVVLNEDNDSLSNNLPVATDDSGDTDEDVPVTINVLTNDSGLEDGGLVVTIVAQPENGSVVVNEDNTLTITPDSDVSGSITFDYQVCDVDNDCSTATVVITVNPINDAPVATDDVASVDEDGVLNGTTLLSNDSDPDGDELTINTTPVTGPTNGSLVINADGTYTYTPDADFNGEDSFVYEVCDSNGACD
ncbi:Calx-beta domain-containing protein, partial [Plebeiibacterium marinum]